MSRERYLLERDTMADKLGLKDTYKKAQKSMSGINLSRGIGRGLGLLGALALAPTGASVPLLAMYGGLGSLGGSFLGGAIGKHKYGGPAKASQDQLFHRDVAEEQREGVDQYWKGLKEQTAVNALQDAVTAGMYGTKVKDMMSQAKIQLGGTPKGMGVPTAPAPIQQVDPSGLVPDYQQQQLGQYLDQIKQSNAANLMTPTADVAGTNIGSGISTTAAPATQYTQGINYKDVVGKNQLAVDPNKLNVDQLKSDMTRGVDQRIVDAIDVSPDVGVQTGFKNQTVAVDETRAAIDNAMGLSGKSPLFSQPPAAGSYTTDVLSSYGTGPNFLQDAVTNTGYTGSAAQNRQLIDYYNQTSPIQYNSIVDMLKAQGQGSSFDARTNLWNQLSQMGVR